MDKNAIKKYAVWARNELIARVSQRAQRYGITKDQIVDANADSVNGIILTDTEKKQRQALIQKIREKGFEQVMEEVAYTWFNRFSALRFMEVNGYLPSHVRVFTDQNNAFKPEIMAEAIHLDLDGLDMEKVYALKEANNDDELFKYLIITQCNDLSKILPGMFQKIADYTELLFPDNLLREGSVIERMIALIPEEDWKDQVQIIGWLYQYYNIEPKAEVFSKPKGIKIEKKDIPAATELFTPDWIVRYMVENSLGRLWIEGHPNNELKSQWKYFLGEVEQEPDVQKQLTEIRKEYSALKPEEIKCIDPCCGSGHILAYMFDVLIQIYGAYGISARDAAASIIKNNIYCLDIDERAAQLAYFSIMMKGRQYDRRFFCRKIQPNVSVIKESNNIDQFALSYFYNHDNRIETETKKLLSALKDAEDYGSIINIQNIDFNVLDERISEVINDIDISQPYVMDHIVPLIKEAETLSQKYHVVATNPPYMAMTNANAKLSAFVKKNYPDSKADLFAVFIEKCGKMLLKNGFQSMVTMHSWMFLSSFENLRQTLLSKNVISMAHLGARAFEEIGGEVVQTTSFVIRNSFISSYRGTYVRLTGPTSQNAKKDMFLSGENRFYVSQDEYLKIPGNPVAYWVGDNVFKCFETGKPFAKVGNPRVGMQTSNNDKFLRLWHEVNYSEFMSSSKKWIKYVKGGSYRRWYGNLDYLVWYNSDPAFIMQQKNARVLPESELSLLKCTWTDLATSRYSCRLAPIDSFHDISGHCFYPNERNIFYLLAFANTKVFQLLIDLLNSSLHYQVGDVARIPVIEANDPQISELCKECVTLSKEDWDAFETSWDFKRNPLIPENIGSNVYLRDIYNEWSEIAHNRFVSLHQKEELLNEKFIQIYGLQDELDKGVEEKDITVRLADVSRDIKGLISYAVGCMFGRYSVDIDGIAYAGGNWNGSNYLTFSADKDNIIPICDDEYFEDDIAGRFEAFIRVVYGTKTLEDNLAFIAKALGGKGQSRNVIREYFINDFYTDHLKIYQKRPIYWLFDSGKKNGFKCLIYMHRYQPDTIARIRTDYVHEQQSRYRTAIADLEQRIESASTSDRVKLSKKLKHLQEQSAEIHDYEEKIHHLADQYISIDLDDGVKVNYAKFQDVLAKIK